MVQVETKYYRHLANLFSRKTLIGISQGKFPKPALDILALSGFLDGREYQLSIINLFEELYDFLLHNYRCEYLYKNILTNEILNRYHSESAAILTEFRVDNCLADFVVLNGTSCVYEIKTELDNFDRLERQIAAYRKVFDKIYLVTHHTYLHKLKTLVDQDVGIICMNNNFSLLKEREATSNKLNVDSGVIFDSLRVPEFTGILKKQLGYVPKVPNTLRYTVCRDLINQIPSQIVHDEMVEQLKNRLSSERIKSAISCIPRSLKLLYLESKFNIRENNNFITNIQEDCHLDVSY